MTSRSNGFFFKSNASKEKKIHLKVKTLVLARVILPSQCSVAMESISLFLFLETPLYINSSWHNFTSTYLSTHGHSGETSLWPGWALNFKKNTLPRYISTQNLNILYNSYFVVSPSSPFCFGSSRCCSFFPLLFIFL